MHATLTVIVDQAEWNAEYGDNESRADIREAVRMMALDSLTAATQHLRPRAIVDVDRADWATR
jgi:hypothetical protein